MFAIPILFLDPSTTAIDRSESLYLFYLIHYNAIINRVLYHKNVQYQYRYALLNYGTSST